MRTLWMRPNRDTKYMRYPEFWDHSFFAFVYLAKQEPSAVKQGDCPVKATVPLFIMAGAGRNRTHQRRISRLPDGFEDRAGHQSRFTPRKKNRYIQRFS